MDKEIGIVLSVAVLGIATIITVPARYLCKKDQQTHEQYKILDQKIQPVQTNSHKNKVREDELDLPKGFRSTGNFSWNSAASRVAFFITDQDLNVKLAITDSQTSIVELLDPPEGVTFDLEVLPVWSNEHVIFMAGGKAYVTKTK